jgi:hypothetical protein
MGIRAASRVANTLRAGEAVADYGPLADCEVVLVAVPAAKLDQTLDDLASHGLPGPRQRLIVIDSWRDTAELSAFNQRGAHVATADRLETGGEPLLVLQGDAASLRLQQGWFAESRMRSLTIESGQKCLLLAAQTLATSLAFPLINACVDTLLNAGLNATQAHALADAWLARTRRSLARAGRKGWTGVLAERDRAGLRRDWEAIARRHPARAEFFLRLAIESLDYLDAGGPLSSEIATWTRPTARSATCGRPPR